MVVLRKYRNITERYSYNPYLRIGMIAKECILQCGYANGYLVVCNAFYGRDNAYVFLTIVYVIITT